jgi:hypothetical protein
VTSRTRESTSTGPDKIYQGGPQGVRAVLGARWTTLNGIAFNLCGIATVLLCKVHLYGLAERVVLYRRVLNDRQRERFAPRGSEHPDRGGER